MSPTSESFGIWTSVTRFLDTLIATSQNRIELFAVELQEQKCRLIEAILLAAALAALGLMGLTLMTLTVVLLFWENGRLAALASLGAAYLVGTGFVWRSLQSRLNSSSPFSGTIEELKKDRACLKREN